MSRYYRVEKNELEELYSSLVDVRIKMEVLERENKFLKEQMKSLTPKRIITNE